AEGCGINGDSESGAVLAEQAVEIGLDDWKEPRLDGGHPGRIGIERHDVETLGGCSHGGDEPEVSETGERDDRRVHRELPSAAAASVLRTGFSTRSLPRLPPSPFRHSIVK